MNALKTLHKTFNYLDLISSGPKLIHKGSERYINTLGATFTLIAIALSSYINFEDLQNYIENKDPQYSESSSYSNTQKLQVNTTTLKFFFTLQNFDVDNSVFSLIPISTLPNIPAEYGYLNITTKGYTSISMKFTENYTSYSEDFQKCDDEFFKDYNEHLEYGQKELTPSQLNDLKNSSLCISPKLKGVDIFSQQDQYGTKYALSMIFYNEFYRILVANGYKYPTLVFNYHHIVVNPNETYYDNATYCRKIWKYRTLSLTDSRTYINYARISKTDITRKRKLIFFKREDENTTYTIENVEPFFDYKIDSSSYKICNVILLEMSDYHSKIILEYISLGDIISNYGGCSSAMFFFFQTISEFLVAPFLTTSMLNSSFNFHENNLTAEEVNKLLEEIDKMSNEDDIGLRTKRNLKALKFPWKKSEKGNENGNFCIELQNLKDQTITKEVDKSNMILRDDVKINDKTTEVLKALSPQKAMISDPNSVLNLYYSTRKSKVADGWQVFRMTYCGKLCIKKRDSVFINYMSLVDEYSEISNFIKIQREIEILKHMTMNFEERELYLLPSVSIKVQEKEPQNNEQQIKSNDFETNLQKSKDKVKDISVRNEKTKVLMKGIIKSIV